MPFNIKVDFDYFYNKLPAIDKPKDLFQPGSAARATVIKAANEWAQYIGTASDFAEIPIGTKVKVGNPATSDFPNTAPNPQNLPEIITLNTQTGSVQDLTIFIGSRPNALVPGNIAQAKVGEIVRPSTIPSSDINDYDYLNASRFGIKYQPSVGSITFNRDLPFNKDYTVLPTPTQYDLYTVALHEIAHILAFNQDGRVINPPVSAFDLLTKSVNSQFFFAGINAKAVSSPGSPDGGLLQTGLIPAPIPQNPNAATTLNSREHFDYYVQTPQIGGGTAPELMVARYNFGERRDISQLDLAVLADVGYDVINAGFSPTPITLTAPIPVGTFISGYAVAGTKNDDTITGNTGNDTLAGGPGNDTLLGGDGDDALYGGYGDDSLNGGKGKDTIDGDPGNDYYKANDPSDVLVPGTLENKVAGGSGSDTLIGSSGDDFLDGGDDDDVAQGSEGNDTIAGGIGNDTVSGNAGTDSLLGSKGNDVVNGGQGNDVVYGNLGNDSVSGNLDNDVIIGTSGQIANPGLGELDTLSGGTGLDRFVLADSTALYYKGTGNQDFALITDFSFTEGDRIELKSGINYQVAPVTVTSFPKGLGIFDGSDLIALVQNLTIADATKLKGIFTLV